MAIEISSASLRAWTPQRLPRRLVRARHRALDRDEGAARHQTDVAV
jgi:hypothetical protein